MFGIDPALWILIAFSLAGLGGYLLASWHKRR